MRIIKMNSISFLTLAIALQCHVVLSHAVPTRATSQILLGEVDIAVQDESTKDIITEEPYLRKCIVDSKAYSHSQTIPSYDPNSHCLCVAGEVYCWWQNFHQTTDVPTDASHPLIPLTTTTTTTTTTIESDYYSSSSLEGNTETSDSYESSGDLSEESNLLIEQQHRPYVKINTTYSVVTTTITPTTCLVMGKQYRQGEVLPHSTGNCIECSCGAEGRVECSPRDCIALQPEVPVAPDIPEAPDGEFEVFNLGRDRGIDESF